MDLDVQKNPVIPSGSSWWSYLGLASSTSLPPPVPLPEIETTEPAGEIYLATEPIVNDSRDKVDGVPEIASSTQVSVQREYGDSDGIRPPSMLSAEQSSRASWFGYLWGRSAIAHDSSVAYDQPSSEAESAPNGPTESERISEDVQAHEAVKDVPQTPTSGVGVNPVLNADTKSAWISFFSRGRTPTRAITNDDGGTGAMEVMTIDEPGAPIPTVASATPPKSTQSSPALKSRDLSPSPTPPKAALGSGQPLPSASAKANQKKPSDSRRVLSQPRLPNLVLPTWGDTFYAPPRGDVLSTDSPLRKTFNIVSRLLMTPPSVDPELAEYRRERRNRYFSGDHTSRTSADDATKWVATSTRDLPRAWNVLGDLAGLGDLASVRRIVVIGVHG